MKLRLLRSVSVLGALTVAAGVGIEAHGPTFPSYTASDTGTLASGAFSRPTRFAAFDHGALVRGLPGRHPDMSKVDQATPKPNRPTFADRGTRQVEASTSKRANLVVYVITGGSEFGAVDLSSGTFLPIGPSIPPDLGGGLVPGPRGALLTLSFSGNLVAIDPATGATSVVGSTGLVDCSTPSSPCGPNSANVIGHLDGRLYATDFANNLYSVDAATGAATLIGPTGIPAISFVPFSANPDGTLNVYSESLFSVRGRLYATFGTAAINPKTGTATDVIPGAVYEIDRKTGQAMLIAPTDTHLTSVVNVSDAVYAFDVATHQVVTLDVRTGQIMPLTDPGSVAGLIGGATPARPVQPGLR